MDIYRYLAEMFECPDEHVHVGYTRMTQLRRDFGVYDNYPIILRADFGRVLTHFGQSMLSTAPLAGAYIPYDIVKRDKDHSSYRFHDIDKKVMLQIQDYMHYTSMDERHAEFQRGIFNMCILLHPFNGKEITSLAVARKMAETIDDICTYAMQRKLPLCLPNSAPFARVDEDEDDSRIVYHDVGTSPLER